MGRFRCVNCKCQYESRRFFWEHFQGDGEGANEEEAAIAAAMDALKLQLDETRECSTPAPEALEKIGGPAEADDDAEFAFLQQVLSPALTAPRLTQDEHEQPTPPASDNKPSSLVALKNTIGVENQIEPTEEGVDGFACSPMTWKFLEESTRTRAKHRDTHHFVHADAASMTSASTAADTSDEESEESREEQEEAELALWLAAARKARQSPEISETRGKRSSATTAADLMRASGTCANIAGTALQTSSAALSGFSAVGGVVGVSAGAYQLHQGLCAPSGIVDPHLVTKGGISSSVGATCMSLGVAAFWCPPLFIAAMGLGVAGLLGVTTVDATMDGLCDECRQGEHSDQLELCEDGECSDEEEWSAEYEWNKFLVYDEKDNSCQAENVMLPEKTFEVDDPIACEDKFRLLGSSFL